MRQTPAESEAALREAVERLATRFHLLKIILYGSRRAREMAESVRQAVLRQLPRMEGGGKSYGTETT